MIESVKLIPIQAKKSHGFVPKYLSSALPANNAIIIGKAIQDETLVKISIESLHHGFLMS